MPGASLVWFRGDLRLSDNPALAAACETGTPVVPVFIWSPEEEASWAPGAASRWWLHHSLESLDRSLQRLGSRLIVRQGPSVEVLRGLAKETGAEAVFLNRRHEPALDARDAAVVKELMAAGIAVRGFLGALVRKPGDVLTATGKPYQVFTAFWNAWSSLPPAARPLSAPKKIPLPKAWPDTERLADLKLLPTIGWDKGLRSAWTPGEPEARKTLTRFLENAVDDYDSARDFPAQPGTSRLSPSLHFGEISVREALALLAEARRGRPSAARSADRFHKELAWREFAQHLLHHFSDTPVSALRPAYDKFPWLKDGAGLECWKKGLTGYPIVDAGMRELWNTGWMHNRVRMITASFLVKDLLVDWREGARWFWDTLVDADLANNTLGWQWAAGCGADAAPYFRIFNPTLQGEKFDPEGRYVSRWVPELSRMPLKWINRPWEAPQDVLASAGVRLGKDYPAPIVNHPFARERALAALKRIKLESVK